MSLPVGVAAAAPWVGFAVGVVLFSQVSLGWVWELPGTGTPLVVSTPERERGWDGFAKPALGTRLQSG